MLIRSLPESLPFICTVSSEQARMTIEQFDALVRAELDCTSNPHNLQGSNKSMYEANISRFGNRNSFSRNLSTQNALNKVNFPKQNFKKKKHCRNCGKLDH